MYTFDVLMYVYILAAEIALIKAATPHAPYIYICT